MEHRDRFLSFAILILVAAGASFAQTYVSGAVSGVWDSTGSPFYVTDSICVPSGDSLRIGPGVEVIFQGHYKFCVDSNAVLKAIGTAEDSIIFTAEDTALTDSTGGWSGLVCMDSTSFADIRYSILEYARPYAFVNSRSLSTLSNCTIHSCVNGVYTTLNASYDFPRTHVIISNSVVHDNIEDGLSCSTDEGGLIKAFKTEIRNCRLGISGRYAAAESCVIEDNTLDGFSSGHSYYYIKDCIFRNNGGDAINGSAWSGDVYGCLIENNDGYAIYQSGCMCSQHMHVNGNTIRNNGGGVYIDIGDAIELSDNVIYGNVGNAVEVKSYCWYPEQNLVISGNIIYDNSGMGIIGEETVPSFSWNESNMKFTNNLVYDNASGCVELFTLAEEPLGVEIINNTVEDLTLTSSDTFTTAYVFNNAFVGPDSSLDIDPGITQHITNNIDYLSSLLDFVDPYHGDFHLREVSECVDGGLELLIDDTDTIFAPDRDVEGNERPRGYTWDIGAYESPYTISLEIELSQGWAMLSMPTEDSSYFDMILPYTAGPIYAYENDSVGYVIATTFEPGVGYWFPIDSTLCDTSNSHRIHTLIIYLNRGWNLIGNCGYPVSADRVLGLPWLIPPIFGYEPVTRSYFPADSLYPGKAYWIYTTMAWPLGISPY